MSSSENSSARVFYQCYKMRFFLLFFCNRFFFLALKDDDSDIKARRKTRGCPLVAQKCHGKKREEEEENEKRRLKQALLGKPAQELFFSANIL